VEPGHEDDYDSSYGRRAEIIEAGTTFGSANQFGHVTNGGLVLSGFASLLRYTLDSAAGHYYQLNPNDKDWDERPRPKTQYTDLYWTSHQMKTLRNPFNAFKYQELINQKTLFPAILRRLKTLLFLS